MRRCVWCHGRQGPLEPLEVATTGPRPWPASGHTFEVHPEHRAAAEHYFEAVHRGGRRFLFVVVGLALAPVVAIPLDLTGALPADGIGLVTGASLVAIGAVIWFRPFCTPETIGMFGVRRSIRIARALAALTAALGVALPILVGRAG